MLIGTIFRLAAMGATVAAAAFQPQTGNLSWTLQDFKRTCNDTANFCVYSFAIDKNDGSSVSPCLYSINGSNLSARITDYQQVQCAPESQYTLNQGWSGTTQSITLVVIDNLSTPKYNAFFGYTVAQMIDGQIVTPDETRTPVPVGAFSKRSSFTSTGWEVKNFTRDCYDADFNCVYDFYISNSTTEPDYYCRIVWLDNNGGTASKDSWYSQSCLPSPSDWVISWGYDVADDLAVMTVVNEALNEDAFFGWDNVSASYSLPDNGPSIVYPIGTI